VPLPAAGELPKLLLRQLAELTSLSNPYLSQLARGTHQPAVRVLKLISRRSVPDPGLAQRRAPASNCPAALQ
jgi:transcriptional regulator with XRE-family HTH domain